MATKDSTVFRPGELSVQAEVLLVRIRERGYKILHSELASLGATTDSYFELWNAGLVFEYLETDVRTGVQTRTVRAAYPKRPKKVQPNKRLQVGL